MDYIRQELLRQQHILTTLLLGLQTTPDSTESSSPDIPSSLRFTALSKSLSTLQPTSQSTPSPLLSSLSDNLVHSLPLFSSNPSNHPSLPIPVSSSSFDNSFNYPFAASTVSTAFTNSTHLTNPAHFSNFINPSINLTNSLNFSLNFPDSYQSFQESPLNSINSLSISTLSPILPDLDLDNTHTSSDFATFSSHIYTSYITPAFFDVQNFSSDFSPKSNSLPVYPLINSTQDLYNLSPSYTQSDLSSKTNETLSLFDSPDSISNSKDLQPIKNSPSSPLTLDQKTIHQNLDLNALSLQTPQNTQIFHITPHIIPNSIPDFIPSSISDFIQNTHSDSPDTALNTVTSSKQNQFKTAQSQSQVITEWTEIQDTPSASPQTFSRAFQRDARRYDGGFNLF